jgi:hypothetical protein
VWASLMLESPRVPLPAARLLLLAPASLLATACMMCCCALGASLSCEVLRPEGKLLLGALLPSPPPPCERSTSDSSPTSRLRMGGLGERSGAAALARVPACCNCVMQCSCGMSVNWGFRMCRGQAMKFHTRDSGDSLDSKRYIA